MITIKKNNPIIPTAEIYPYYLENSWEQRIDCSENELKDLYENLKGIFYPEIKRDFYLNGKEGE